MGSMILNENQYIKDIEYNIDYNTMNANYNMWTGNRDMKILDFGLLSQIQNTFLKNKDMSEHHRMPKKMTETGNFNLLSQIQNTLLKDSEPEHHRMLEELTYVPLRPRNDGDDDWEQVEKRFCTGNRKEGGKHQWRD